MVKVSRSRLRACIVGPHFFGTLILAVAFFSVGGSSRGDVSLARLQHYLLNYRYVPVPTDLVNENQQQVEVRINGKRVHLVVDTGSDFTTLSRDCASRLKAAVQESGESSLGAGGMESGTTGLATVNSFTIQDDAINQPGVVHVLPEGENIPGADGLFGFDSLWMNSAIILVGGEGILLRPGAREPRAPLKAILRREGYAPVPFSVSLDRIIATGSLNGHPLSAEIDCGAASSFFDVDYLKQIGTRTHWYPLTMMGVDGRAVSVRQFRPDNMMLGGYQVPGREMLAGSSPLLTMAHIQAVLGFDFLRSHRAIIDLGSNLLWLKN